MLLDEKGLFDIVMLLTMALLNHLVWRVNDEPLFNQLDPLVSWLRQLVELDDDEVKDLFWLGLVYLHTAHPLNQLVFCSMRYNGDTDNEGFALYRPTKVLDLGSDYWTNAQAHCCQELCEVIERDMMFDEQLHSARLLDELHVGHVRYAEFGAKLIGFENRRMYTFKEVKDCARVVEASVVEGFTKTLYFPHKSWWTQPGYDGRKRART